MPFTTLSPEDANNPDVITYLQSISSRRAPIRFAAGNTPVQQPELKTIHFNRYLWSESPQVDNAVRHIVDSLCRYGFIPAHIKPVKLYPTAKIVLLNLYRARIMGADHWVTYSRDKNTINAPKRYRKSGFNYISLILFVRALQRLERIITANGYHDRSHYGKTPLSRSKPSRMKATRDLEVVFHKYGIQLEHICRDPKQELIEKKKEADDNDNRKLLVYVDTVATGKMRKVLRSYNQLLKSSDIRLTITPSRYVDFSDTTVKRVFNNDSWSQGGRFYGGWWQSIKSRSRHHITINGNATMELDYKALHPFMLYQKEGAVWNNSFDPYALSEHAGHTDQGKLRKLSKDFLLVSLNAASENGAIKAMQRKIAEDKENEGRSYPDSIPPLKTLLNAIRRHNAPIGHHFCSGIGISLQYQDSCIAERIIKTMTNEGKSVLCLHDGFRCEVQHEEQLRQLMAECFMLVTRGNTYPHIELKIPS
jgi:hypothetical protein